MSVQISPAKKFALLWVHEIKGPTDLVTEHKFHPSRGWKFDYAHLQKRVAIEVEGGIGWTVQGKAKRGHHVTPEGYKSDCEKYNAAAMLGWTVFRLTPAMVNATELQRIAAFINQRPVLN